MFEFLSPKSLVSFRFIPPFGARVAVPKASVKQNDGVKRGDVDVRASGQGRRIFDKRNAANEELCTHPLL